MGTKRLITLLCLVAILGCVAIWNIDTMKEKRMAEMIEAETMFISPEVTTAETSDEAEASADEAVTQSGTAAAAVPSNEASAASGASSIEADMAALDAMYEADYDDSGLDATFTNEGATVLSEPYDI